LGHLIKNYKATLNVQEGQYVCGGNVRPKRIKKVISKSLGAVSSEAGILVL